LATSTAPRVAAFQGIHWEYLVPITTVHLLACLALLPAYFSWPGVALAVGGTAVFGTLGINLCYHRLLAHRSLKVPRWLERTLATFALCSLEDTVGWLFHRAPERKTCSFFDRYARDILADRYFRFLERHPTAIVWIYAMHAVIFWTVGLLVGRWLGGDWEAGYACGMRCLVWGVFVRTVLVWHITWSVNSLTHLFGYRTYTTGEDSRNNWLVAILAMGEGWHNNHHHDPASASVQHKWWEIDMTYYVILLLKWVGLATDVIAPRHVRRATSR